MDIIKKTSREYIIWTLFFTLSLFCGTVSCDMFSYGLISALFHFIFSTAYIWGWQMLARRSPDILSKYYLAGSAFRLMAASVVLLVFCVVNRGDIETIKWFSVVFIIFYLVILLFDAIFFANVSKNNKVIK